MAFKQDESFDAEQNPVVKVVRRLVPMSPDFHDKHFFTVENGGIRARIFERGVGETLSSGTGASGAAVAAFLGGARSPITVVLDGGELVVEVSDDLDVSYGETRARIAPWRYGREFFL